MQDQTNLPRTKCPSCGKIVPRRDIRDRRPQFCGKICAQLMRYSTRYKGSNAGPADQPKDLMEKTKWQG